MTDGEQIMKMAIALSRAAGKLEASAILLDFSGHKDEAQRCRDMAEECRCAAGYGEKSAVAA